MKPVISVVICTYNPNLTYLSRVLEALRFQTLPMEKWELLLIDNASTESLISKIALDWHPASCCIRENNLGLVHARLRGIQESKSELIVFVDDDNILDKNYLETVLEISYKWSMLGAWGGQCIAEFESVPPVWTKPFLEMLAIREFNHDRWSNIPYRWEELPIGAGSCYRKAVAEEYFHLVHADPKRSKLGSTGALLLRGEDLDMGFTAYDMGLGVGIFASLKLLHIIPANRLEEQYLLKLIEGTYYSGMVLRSFRTKATTIPFWKHKIRLLMLMILGIINPKMWLMLSRKQRFYLARRRGELLGMIEIFKYQQDEKTTPERLTVADN